MSLGKTHHDLDAGQYSIHRYLVVKSKEGDRRAQSELYQLYVKAMYNISRRMMGDEDEAKDVLQDAFIDAFGKIKSLEDVDMFSAWIKRIVVNKCLNALRKKKLQMNSLEESVDVPEEIESDDFQEFTARRIMKALDQISEGCKTVFNLYLFEGYDHKEIGDILGITESASKAQYCKAKMKIRKVLENNQLSYG